MRRIASIERVFNDLEAFDNGVCFSIETEIPLRLILTLFNNRFQDVSYQRAHLGFEEEPVKFVTLIKNGYLDNCVTLTFTFALHIKNNLYSYNYIINLKFISLMMQQASKYIPKDFIPVTTAIHLIECPSAFAQLTTKEKLYSYYLARASWEGSKICWFQRSYESPALLVLLKLLYSS